MNPASEKMKLIICEVTDLSRSMGAYLAEKDKLGRKPQQGDGAEYREDGYGGTYLHKEGLPQGATATALKRKIVNIRDHLNELGKLV